MNDFNIQWLTQDQTLFEVDWLKLLFNQTQKYINIEYDPNKIKTDKNTVLICNHAVPYRYVLDQLRHNGKKYVIVLLSDENLYDPCEWLHDPNCLGLLRNYVNPTQVHHPKVKIFGLGYKREFAELCAKTKADRVFTWCFAGTAHGDRPKMLEIFKNLGSNLTHNCSGFGACDALSTKNYVETLKNSLFALCPPGQDSNDTFRVYEALEAGCIPITLRKSNQFDIYPSYWHAVFRGSQNIPFVIAEDWDDAIKKVKEFDDEQIVNLQIQCEKFWSDSKTKFKQLFVDATKKL